MRKPRFKLHQNCVNNSVLPDPQKRERAILQLDALISSVDADGINVDIEGMDASQRLNLNLFISELKQVVPEVVIATPAIDWSNAYDYNTLASLSDGLFIMGYGYHWSGGDPGPVDPLNGNSPWSQYSLAWSVQDYINDGVPKDKIILGLPLYGRKWPTTNNTIPGTATGTGIPVIMNDAVVEASIMGSLYDTPSQTPYILYNNEQLWYGDVESVRERIRFAVSSDIQGIGFWALTYENGVSGFWEMVNQETTDIEPNDDTGQPDLSDSGTIPDTNDSGSIPDPNSPPIANAGEDQMVRVDQGASLFGSASSDPDGDAIQFTWRQVSGPSSTLNDDTTATPEVSFSESGEYEFELRVFDSEFYSNADSVIVEATAQSKETASCHAFPFWTPLWLSPLILLRRRKKHAHPRYYL